MSLVSLVLFRLGVVTMVVGYTELLLVMYWFGVCIMVDGVGGGCDGDGR